MKKIITISLCLILCFAFCACNKDNAKKIKADYNAFDWGKATPAAAKTKAEALLQRIKKLTATEQQELKEIKLKLEEYAKIDLTPSPSPTTTPSATPSASPSATPSATPSASPSATPSNNAPEGL